MTFLVSVKYPKITWNYIQHQVLFSQIRLFTEPIERTGYRSWTGPSSGDLVLWKRRSLLFFSSSGIFLVTVEHRTQDGCGTESLSLSSWHFYEVVLTSLKLPGGQDCRELTPPQCAQSTRHFGTLTHSHGVRERNPCGWGGSTLYCSGGLLIVYSWLWEGRGIF